MKSFLGIAIICFAVSCSKKPETTQPLVQPISESVYASGIVKSKNQYQVFSPVNGIIEQVNITEGSAVKTGETLITLVHESSKINTENARLTAAYSSVSENADKLRESQVNIGLAMARMQNDSLLVQRQRNLWAQEIGTRNELEQRELAWKNSTTSYQSSLLRYSNLKRDIRFSSQQTLKNLQLSSVMSGDYLIKAKRNGRVYSILREPGEMVSTQIPIAIIGDEEEFITELQVDEYDIAKIETGQKVFINMDSYKGKVFEGVICKIDPIMNEATRSFTVEASFSSAPPRLFPYMTVEANILICTRKNVLTIPRSYLTTDNGVILEDGRKRKIVTGLKDYETVEVISGLNSNDIIKKPAE
jgi:HlyD family secretion protein